MELTEELLRQAALASINNALSLHESAVLLTQNGKAPAAAALAIIGAEEFAKAVLYTIAAAVPEERPILEARWWDLREHNVKHVLTGAVEGAYETNSEGWAIVRQESGYAVSAEHALGDMFEALARSGINELIMPRKQAKKYYDEIRRSLGFLSREDMLPSDPSRLKEVALYVDISAEGKLSTPDRVDDREAELCIRGLEYFLGHFHALPSVLEDDEKWAELAMRIRRACGADRT